MKKRSNIIIVVMIISTGIAMALYADHLKNAIEPNPIRAYWGIEIVEGDEFVRELDISYSHLHVEYPKVSIDGRYENHIELSGFAVAADMADYDVCNDTLYIRYSDHLPKFVGRDAEVAVGVHVGGIGLRSITVNGFGRIVIPVRPKGTGRDGKAVYRDDDRERYTMKFDTLDIVNGYVDMLLEGVSLNIHNKSNKNTMFNLQGQVEHVDFKYDNGGNIAVNAYTLDCGTATINTDKNKAGLITGTIQLTVEDTLVANLYGEMDVDYYGDPEVTKYERSTGRVVHMYEHKPWD